MSEHATTQPPARGRRTVPPIVRSFQHPSPWRYTPQTGRLRSDYRVADRGDGRRYHPFQDGAAVCRLARLSAPTILNWRQNASGTHYQTRRSVPSHAAGDGRAGRPARRVALERSALALGACPAAAARLSPGLHRDRGKECWHRMGTVGEGHRHRRRVIDGDNRKMYLLFIIRRIQTHCTS